MRCVQHDVAASLVLLNFGPAQPQSASVPGLSQAHSAPPGPAHAAPQSASAPEPPSTHSGPPNPDPILPQFPLTPGPSPADSDPAQAQPGPLRVTTDTVEYCGHLAGRIAVAQRTTTTANPEAESLAAQGRHMCEIGRIRGGIARLRRALLMLMQTEK